MSESPGLIDLRGFLWSPLSDLLDEGLVRVSKA